jgi:hypothetical protein
MPSYKHLAPLGEPTNSLRFKIEVMSDMENLRFP